MAIRTIDIALRYGQVGERWGNVLLPAGALEVGDLFRFEEEGEKAPAYRVTRVNGFPQDPAKRLYYYLRMSEDNRTDS